MPQLSVNKCHNNRTAKMIDDGVPCGLVGIQFAFYKTINKTGNEVDIKVKNVAIQILLDEIKRERFK